jgi:signal transduction histidine kinase
MRSLRGQVARNEKSIVLLTDTNLRLQKHAMSIGDESRVEERQKITRDLHDIVGYSLTSISMMLEYGEDLLVQNKNQKLSEILKTAADQARNGMYEVRKALRQLREIQELEVPYFNKIKGIVENFSLVTGIDISLEFGNITSDLNKRGEEFVYRFLQEGLTNSFRHGRATSIRIILLQERDNLILSIEDNGVGSMDIVEGIGLNGMHERIVEQGGSIKYTSKAEGFTIIARLPLNKMQGDDYEQ